MAAAVAKLQHGRPSRAAMDERPWRRPCITDAPTRLGPRAAARIRRRARAGGPEQQPQHGRAAHRRETGGFCSQRVLLHHTRVGEETTMPSFLPTYGFLFFISETLLVAS